MLHINNVTSYARYVKKYVFFFSKGVEEVDTGESVFPVYASLE